MCVCVYLNILGYHTRWWWRVSGGKRPVWGEDTVPAACIPSAWVRSGGRSRWSWRSRCRRRSRWRTAAGSWPRTRWRDRGSGSRRSRAAERPWWRRRRRRRRRGAKRKLIHLTGLSWNHELQHHVLQFNLTENVLHTLCSHVCSSLLQSFIKY